MASILSSSIFHGGLYSLRRVISRFAPSLFALAARPVRLRPSPISFVVALVDGCQAPEVETLAKAIDVEYPVLRSASSITARWLAHGATCPTAVSSRLRVVCCCRWRL